MGGMSIWHWLIVLLVIVLLFGAKKIPELAKGLGSGIRTFKKELDSDKKDDEKDVSKTESSTAKATPEASIKEPQKVEVIEAQIIESTPSHKEKA